MNQLLQAPWFISLAGCLLYWTTTTALLCHEHFHVQAPPAARLTPNDDPSWRFRNPEFEQWVQELRQEKEALDTRDKQLRDLQTRLEAERQEILSVTQTVHQLQADFDKNVVRFQEQEAENLKHQAKIVAGMSPEGAGAMFAELPLDDAVRILFTLKADVASQVLEAMSKMGRAEAKRAAD